MSKKQLKTIAGWSRLLGSSLQRVRAFVLQASFDRKQGAENFASSFNRGYYMANTHKFIFFTWNFQNVLDCNRKAKVLLLEQSSGKLFDFWNLKQGSTLVYEFSLLWEFCIILRHTSRCSRIDLTCYVAWKCGSLFLSAAGYCSITVLSPSMMAYTNRVITAFNNDGWWRLLHYFWPCYVVI